MIENASTCLESLGERELLNTEMRLMAATKKIGALIDQILGLQAQLEQLREQENDSFSIAVRDELTSLPNRRLLKDRLHQAIAHASRHNQQVALLMFDLNHFKHVNETIGLPAGDQLLRSVARRLLSSVRAADTVCRYGSDEFVLILPDMAGPNAVAAALGRIHARVQMPYFIGEKEINLTASISCSVYPGDGKTYSELIDRADMEMFRLKAKSRSYRRLFPTGFDQGENR